MASRLKPKESRAEKPGAKKAPSRMKAAANGPAGATGVEPATAAKKRLPAATVRAKKAVESDEMSRELDHERGSTVSTLSPGKTAPAIWGRIVTPDQATLTPELARAFLKLDFDPEDHQRVDELSATAQKGTLTPEERAELEEYIRVGCELAVLQSKARVSLKRANRSS
jgi:hypothetical protein